MAAFFFGLKVVSTVGKGIVDPSAVNEYVISGGLIGAILLVYTCSHYGIPISVSHSLIGGLMGPVIIKAGPGAIISAGLTKVLIFIVVAPLTGITLSYFIMIFTMWIFKNIHPRRVDSLFRVLQLLSSAIFSIGHGSNDAQKTMGVGLTRRVSSIRW